MTTGSPTSEVDAMCKRLRREWPISTLSPHIGTQPVNPDGPEAATLLQSLEARIEELEKLLGMAAPFVGWASTRHQIVAGIHADELCDTIDAALTPSNRDRM